VIIQARVVDVMLESRESFSIVWTWLVVTSFVISGYLRCKRCETLSLPLDCCQFISKCVYKHKHI